MTSYPVTLYEDALKAAGAQGLLDKSTLKTTITDVISVVSKETAYPPEQGFPSAEDSFRAITSFKMNSVPVPLTDQERAILVLSARKMNTKQIATSLAISPATVFSHRRNIKNKLDVSSWSDVLEECHRLHIICF